MLVNYEFRLVKVDVSISRINLVALYEEGVYMFVLNGSCSWVGVTSRQEEQILDVSNSPGPGGKSSGFCV